MVTWDLEERLRYVNNDVSERKEKAEENRAEDVHLRPRERCRPE